MLDQQFGFEDTHAAEPRLSSCLPDLGFDRGGVSYVRDKAKVDSAHGGRYSDDRGVLFCDDHVGDVADLPGHCGDRIHSRQARVLMVLSITASAATGASLRQTKPRLESPAIRKPGRPRARGW